MRALLAGLYLVVTSAQNCPGGEITSSTAGDINHPVEVVPGCPYYVEFTEPAGEQLYLVVYRHSGDGTRLEIAWDFESEGPKVAQLYSWISPAHHHMEHVDDPTPQQVSFYYPPLATDGSYTWPGVNYENSDLNPGSHDWYWESDNDELAFRPLYITLDTTYLGGGQFTGEVLFEIVQLHRYINDAAKQSLEALWDECCQPTYDKDFDRAAFIAEHGSDIDQIPHCTWTPILDATPINDGATGLPAPWVGVDNDSCEDLDGVNCDIDGNVIELVVSDKGLQCDQMPPLEGLHNIMILEAANNNIGGTIPPQIVQSPNLEIVQLAHNLLTGTVPCFPSNSLRLVDLDINLLTGTVPVCLFKDSMITIQLSSNLLHGTLPARWGRSIPGCDGIPTMESSSLESCPGLAFVPSQHICTGCTSDGVTRITSSNVGQFYPHAELGGHNYANFGARPAWAPLENLGAVTIANAQLDGTIPGDIDMLPNLNTLDLSQNKLGGVLPDGFFSDRPSLYRFKVPHNEISGTLPPIGANMATLKFLHVDHNHLSGRINHHFDNLMMFENDNLRSSIFLQSNSFSGALPTVVKEITMGEPHVQKMDVGDNYFHCDRDTGTWPVWAMRLSSRSTIGTCMPVPQITDCHRPPSATGSIGGIADEDCAAAVGEPIHIVAASAESGFRATDHFRCKFGDTEPVDAQFDSETMATCIVPDLLALGVARGASVPLTVANYGEDWSSSELLADYMPTIFTLLCPVGFSGHSCEFSDAITCNGLGTVDVSGHCTCHPGVTGAACEFSDAVTCSRNGKVTFAGICACELGYGGDECSVCDTGYNGTRIEQYVSMYIYINCV